MDEKKTYSYSGTVTISTEEYRDLIEAVKDAQKDADDYRSRYWKEQDVSKTANKKAEALQKKFDNWENFLSEHTSVAEDWKNYIVRKMYDEASSAE